MQNIEPRFLLPLGSVVSLKGADKKYMITEYYVKKSKNCVSFSLEKDDNIKYFDYMCVVWPDGDVNPTIKMFFNHSDIDTIHFSGYINDESIEFIDDIKKEIKDKL